MLQPSYRTINSITESSRRTHNNGFAFIASCLTSTTYSLFIILYGIILNKKYCIYSMVTATINHNYSFCKIAIATDYLLRFCILNTTIHLLSSA